MSARAESRTTTERALSDKVVIRWKPTELRFDFEAPAPALRAPPAVPRTSAPDSADGRSAGSVKDAIIRWLEEHV